MKLKDILFEAREAKFFGDLDRSEKNEIAGRLEQQLKSGKWIVKEPWLYRGRSWDGHVKVKDTEKYEKRKTRDTGKIFDYIIHDYTVGCYPDYPDRWQSRFGLTYKGDVDIFGEQTYYIFPHKNSKIIHSVTDSYDIIVDRAEHSGKGKLLDGVSYFYNDLSQNERSWYSQNKNEIEDNINGLIFSLYQIAKNEKETPLSQYGCPKEVLHQLMDHEEKFEGSERKLRKGFTNLKHVYADIITEYFGLYDKGYPETKEDGKGEVIYQGEYLQVHSDVFTYLNRKKAE